MLRDAATGDQLEFETHKQNGLELGIQIMKLGNN